VIWEGLAVEIIKIFWSHGYFVDNRWLQMIHDNWWCHWVAYKTKVTLQDVDKQIEDLIQEAEVDEPVFWEEEGDTPLGGKMGLRAPWLDKEEN
tara:strand:+ start:358 stop:636 length:279 start_codon:yes stop_codon:yes gene_type:complete